jgi:hypothetical protein
MMEAIRSSEPSVLTRATRRRIPEDGLLHMRTVLTEMMKVHDMTIGCRVSWLPSLWVTKLLLEGTLHSVTSSSSQWSFRDTIETLLWHKSGSTVDHHENLQNIRCPDRGLHLGSPPNASMELEASLGSAKGKPMDHESLSGVWPRLLPVRHHRCAQNSVNANVKWPKAVATRPQDVSCAGAPTGGQLLRPHAYKLMRHAAYKLRSIVSRPQVTSTLEI